MKLLMSIISSTRNLTFIVNWIMLSNVIIEVK